jgi:plastocyanin
MKSIIAVIAVIIIVGGGAFALTRASKPDNSSQAKPNTTNTQPADTTPSTTDTNTNSGQTTADTITYSDSGFSPSSLTVKAGTTVTIKNTSSGGLQFDSDPHPEHTDNTELNVGFVASGQSATFTVHRTGSFGYHNHLSPDDRGQLIVE